MRIDDAVDAIRKISDDEPMAGQAWLMLGQVELRRNRARVAEEALRGLGFTDLRVRHHGDIARLELPVGDLVRAVSEPLRARVQAAIRSAGFRYAVIDLAGLQSGLFTLTALAPIDGRSRHG